MNKFIFYILDKFFEKYLGYYSAVHYPKYNEAVQHLMDDGFDFDQAHAILISVMKEDAGL